MTPVVDPFMQDAPVRRPGDFYRTVKGVPLVADPNGTLTKPKSKKDPGHVKRVMYRRPSGFGKQIENTYNLQKWGERQEALGFALDFNILKRATALLDGDRESKEWKDEADQVVVAAKQAAKAWIAAERGTHTHGLAEDDDQDVDIISRIEHGETLGLDRSVQLALVEVWRQMLERNGLEIVAVEFACVNDHYKAAGTGDRVAKLTKSLRFRLITGELVELAAGTYVILDIKTGQYRRDNQGVPLYWQSYAVQVALYAPPGACLYDPDTDIRTPFPWPISEDWAVIAHLDVLGALDGNPSCELILVDLAAGRHAADLCVAARDWENENTVFSVAQLDVEGEGGESTPRQDHPGHRTPSPSTPDVEGVSELTGNDAAASPSTSFVADLVNAQMAAHLAECSDGIEAHATVSPPASMSAAVNAEGVGSSADQPLHPPATLGEQRTAAIKSLVDNQGFVTKAEALVLLTPAIIAERGDTAERIQEALAWASQPAPTPLAPLPANPDEGANAVFPDGRIRLDDRIREFNELEAKYKALDAGSRAWITTLVTQAQQANVSFHTQGGHRTDRRYWIIKGLVDFADDDDVLYPLDDDVLRAICVAALGIDAPLDPRHTAGAVVGSLGAAEAQRFSELVDVYVGTTV